MGQVTAFDRVGWRRSSFRTGATSWAGNCIRRLRIIRTGIKQPCAPHRVRVVVASAYCAALWRAAWSAARAYSRST